MDTLSAGTPASGFCLPDKNNTEICLNTFAGKWVILYFYPKDNTPGCTTEAKGFNEETGSIFPPQCRDHRNQCRFMQKSCKVRRHPWPEKLSFCLTNHTTSLGNTVHGSQRKYWERRYWEPSGRPISLTRTASFVQYGHVYG